MQIITKETVNNRIMKDVFRSDEPRQNIDKFCEYSQIFRYDIKQKDSLLN